MPIGIYNEEVVSFTNKEMKVQDNDVFYLFTDGYVDQIGGPDRKTYKSRKFKKLLREIHLKPLKEQKSILEKEHLAWRSKIEQIDDILIMGIRIAIR